jgi:demethylmenaquinone methyltransferase/2-methoxy-6-polyprenyl-1,4-benzoquinol methylase
VPTGEQANERARALFAPLGPTYDRYARLLSLAQDPRWHRYLVSRIHAGERDRVLDVATGTGAVAIELARLTRAHVTGLDQSPEMLSVARRRVERARLTDRIDLVEGRAEELPFPDEFFHALTFTYLLRYVTDPVTTMRELARVVRPGGIVASLEFGLPSHPLPRLAWELYVRVGLPTAGRILGHGWHEVGRFLGPSIRGYYADGGLDRALSAWLEAGIGEVRYRLLSLGGGIVIWGRRL